MHLHAAEHGQFTPPRSSTAVRRPRSPLRSASRSPRSRGRRPAASKSNDPEQAAATALVGAISRARKAAFLLDCVLPRRWRCLVKTPMRGCLERPVRQLVAGDEFALAARGVDFDHADHAARRAVARHRVAERLRHKLLSLRSCHTRLVVRVAKAIDVRRARAADGKRSLEHGRPWGSRRPGRPCIGPSPRR